MSFGYLVLSLWLSKVEFALMGQIFTLISDYFRVWVSSYLTLVFEVQNFLMESGLQNCANFDFGCFQILSRLLVLATFERSKITIFLEHLDSFHSYSLFRFKWHLFICNVVIFGHFKAAISDFTASSISNFSLEGPDLMLSSDFESNTTNHIWNVLFLFFWACGFSNDSFFGSEILIITNWVSSILQAHS